MDFNKLANMSDIFKDFEGKTPKEILLKLRAQIDEALQKMEEYERRNSTNSSKSR